MSAQWRSRWAALLLVSPAVLLLIAFFVVPSVSLFRLSLDRIDPTLAIRSDLSPSNYHQFATSSYYLKMLIGSIKLTACVTVICLILGYASAYYMIRVRSNLYRTILYAIMVSPLLVSVIVRTYGWIVLLSNNGVVNGVLTYTGVTDQPVRMLGTFGSVLIATVHVLLPFMMLPIASSLQDVDPVLERASQNLGASPLETFFRVTLPLSMPGVLAGTSLVIALTLGIYITPLLIAGPLQPLLAIGIYYVTLSQLNFPLGAAISFVLLAFTLIVIAFSSRLLRMVNRSMV